MRSSPPTRPPPTRSTRPTDAPLRKSSQEFELPTSSAVPLAPPSPAPSPEAPPEPFALPELSTEERAARSFTGDRATFQPPPPTAAQPRRRAALYAGVAAGVLAAVAGVALMLSRDPPAPTDTLPPAPLEAPDAPPPAPAELALTSALGVGSPSSTADDAAEFARHAAAGATAGTAQRVLASCVPAPDGATLVVRATTAGAQRRTAGGVVACAGYDLGVVPDVTADGVEDVIAVGAAADTLVLVDSATLRAGRTAAVAGVRGVAVGAQVRVGTEPVVIVFVEPSGPTEPTEVRGIGAQSLTERWRRRGEGPHARIGHPEELGLAVGPDADGDGVGDVAVGMSPVLGAPDDARCVHLLSGADGHPLWAAPFCRASTRSPQSVSLGPDVNGDGRADAAVGTAHPPEGDVPVVILSGADGSVLRRVAAPPDADGFGASVALGGDVDGDRRPDLVACARASLHVFDAASGERRGGVRFTGGVGVQPRAQVIPALLADSAAAVLVSTAADGLRVFARAGGGL